MRDKLKEKLKTPMMKLINESIEKLNQDGFPSDPELASELTGPERFERTQKHRDEIVIDSLLADISGKTGYFIKLKKEIRPNEYMLMKVIENDWRKWSDMESAVADIVKEHTKVSPQKWGTGCYRVEIACKGGMRGKGYTPVDYFINAEEELSAPPLQNTAQGTVQQIDPNVAVTSKLEELKTLIEAVSGIVPKPQDPSLIQSQIAQAFQQGMAMKTSEQSNSTQMMTAMMTSLIGMVTTLLTQKNNETAKPIALEDQMSKILETLKTYGVIGVKSETKEKTILDFVNELKALGIDLAKKDDPVDQVARLKQLASVASDLFTVHGDEKPGILEKLIDVVGPAIPGMIKDIRDTAEKAAIAQQLASRNMKQLTNGLMNGSTNNFMNGQSKQVKLPHHQDEMTTYQRLSSGVSEHRDHVEHSVSESSHNKTGEHAVSDNVKQFFQTLYDNIKQNNRMFYPVIYTSLLQDAKGIELINGLVTGQSNSKHLIDMIQQYGDERFRDSEFVMKYLVGYVNGFIAWVKQMAGESSKTDRVSNEHENYDVICSLCRTVFTYDNEDEWLRESEKTCGENGCSGVLQPLHEVGLS